jgi:hypothetical protein
VLRVGHVASQTENGSSWADPQCWFHTWKCWQNLEMLAKPGHPGKHFEYEFSISLIAVGTNWCPDRETRLGARQGGPPMVHGDYAW